MDDIRTCSVSLIHPGSCCAEACHLRATVAVLTGVHEGDMVEHTRCETHVPGDAETKPLAWDPDWAPPGRHVHGWSREVVPGVADVGLVERIEIEVQPSGVVIISEEALAQLMVDAGWERTS
ncbi:hypothetical protein [Nocardioides sp. PD653]|uniref:hypothetical protein n=1 Tax=Nocardioides sp. PD653 TaxID=393303 RepID=UPI0009EF8D26|nr:hypothetical protein [Nocardioides sp. PD653]GAW54719.1 hypothetical protein PD653_2133 [Nocardioides sp. PD653]